MIWNKGTVIYTALLALFLGYFTYCNFVGKAIYAFEARNIYGLNDINLNLGHPGYVGGFHHK